MARCGVKQWHGMLRCQQKCLAREEDLEDSMEEEETNGKGKVMKYISSVIKQVELHKQDKFFMKRLLHLITFGYFYYKKDMMKTIKATSMIEQLLSILRELDEGQDQLQVMITSVLYLVGSIDKVREIMRQSKRKDHKIGGSFIFWGEKKDEDEEMSEQNLEITHIDEDQLMSCSVDMDEQILERDEDLIQKDKIQENEKLSSDDSQNFINFDDLMNQMKQQENILPIISQEDKLKQSELVLQTKIPQRVFEKNIFRVCCQFSELKNTRRFGFIAEDSEVLNNIPVANKDFRAVTYDDKDGTIRLGWHEIFKWNPTIKTNQQQWFTFEVDLREDIPYNTIRLFIESEEAPIIFVNIPKKVKIYKQKLT
ncbi:MAG: hypothetical protein EZS28_018804 [Streblomastix strix]|uniref:Uncharacterized protein n=1 Tax=Streblomastix strix TaxID=222440 RepID=A0A5J4VSV0_9EUKA|nr:MAG: hypothetical protein EZS28_018804 [Streblomastix strix]